MIKKQILKSKKKAKVTFTLPKEATNGAKDVILLGEFNNWNVEEGIPMKVSKGNYKAVIELAGGRDYEFRYLIDKQVWENDWAADGYVQNAFGVHNSVVTVPEVPATITSRKKTTTKRTTTKSTARKTTRKMTTDKLTKIEGIGPKIEKLLNKAGIHTFMDLSKATNRTLKNVLADAGSRYQMHDPSTWSRQAKLAVNGKWDELKKLQDKLNGGRV